MAALFKDFLKDESGATAIEYALIASLIAIAAILAIGNVGTSVKNKFEDVSTKLNDANNPKK